MQDRCCVCAVPPGRASCDGRAPPARRPVADQGRPLGTAAGQGTGRACMQAQHAAAADVAAAAAAGNGNHIDWACAHGRHVDHEPGMARMGMATTPMQCSSLHICGPWCACTTSAAALRGDGAWASYARLCMHVVRACDRAHGGRAATHH